MKENILLLCNVPPCKNYPEASMTSNLMRFLLEEKLNVYCYSIMSSYLEPDYWEDIENNFQLCIVDRPKEKKNTKSYYNEIERLSDNLLKYVNKHKITKVWCTLEDEILVNLMKRLFEKTNIFYVVQIVGSVKDWMKDSSFDEKRKKEIEKAYEYVLKNASKVVEEKDRNNLKKVIFNS